MEAIKERCYPLRATPSKLVKAGRSANLFLNEAFMLRNGLKPGDKVYQYMTPDGDLLVSTTPPAEAEETS